MTRTWDRRIWGHLFCPCWPCQSPQKHMMKRNPTITACWRVCVSERTWWKVGVLRCGFSGVRTLNLWKYLPNGHQGCSYVPQGKFSKRPKLILVQHGTSPGSPDIVCELFFDVSFFFLFFFGGVSRVTICKNCAAANRTRLQDSKSPSRRLDWGLFARSSTRARHCTHRCSKAPWGTLECV